MAQRLDDADNARKLQKLRHSLAQVTPLPRSGLADDIANAVLHVASDEASFINCHELVVDGERIASFHERPPTEAGA